MTSSPAPAAKQMTPSTSSLLPSHVLRLPSSPLNSFSSSVSSRLFVSLPLPILVLSWYVFGLTTILSTKHLLTSNSINTLQLTCLQFAVPSLPMLLANKSRKAIASSLFSSSPPSLVLLGTSLSYSLGFLLTTLSFSLSAASTVESLKASTPMTTALIALLTGVDTVNARQGASLAVIIIGVMYTTSALGSAVDPPDPLQPSSSSSAASRWPATLCILTSNFFFSLRSLGQSYLRGTYSNVNHDPVRLFQYMSLVGFSLSSSFLMVRGSTFSRMSEGLGLSLSASASSAPPPPPPP
eukprot:CAMPEP_0182485086 /NCGR_PEP_ID=MMETSP1319-20130603/44591_1 /TAXON_ID=172717 /ORGANISM="Bolidomonas pacifica, Strain RCC208" /LENGTH=295 /DNA_ID=CAMNT_0024687029 /DNA_START=124 /DNA_END=1007 /DNA_ORIENTATION=+